MDAENGSDMLGAKKLNYEFLMLVRDQKYPGALMLGKKSRRIYMIQFLRHSQTIHL